MKRKYNVALLHYSCPPIVGGVEEVVREQAHLLTGYYHNVKVFSGDGGRFYENIEVELNPLLGSRNKDIIKAHEESKAGNTKVLESLSKDIYNYLSEQLKGFDILIAHNVLTMPYNLPLSAGLHRVARDGIIPIISWNHDSPYFYPDYPAYLDVFPWNILKRAYAGIYYVAISESRKRMFSKLYGKRKNLYVIPNGIDPVRFFKLDPLTVRLIREEDLFRAEFIMVQPSRLIPRKNIELSIKVTAELQKLGVKARLLITGAHDPHEPKSLRYFNKLRRIARTHNIEKDVIIITGHKLSSGEKLRSDRIIIRDLYLISDVLFLPSIQEGFGIPLLEAGMIKLPIVCSNIPPFKEIGGDDICMFDIDETPEEIAIKIRDFAQALKPHRMFRKVISNYAWDNIYHKYLLPLLNKIINKRDV